MLRFAAFTLSLGVSFFASAAQDHTWRISGFGYFAFQDPNSDERVFARVGELEQDDKGYLVDKRTGYRLVTLNARGEIQRGGVTGNTRGINDTLESLRVNEDGLIEALYRGRVRPRVLGTVPVALFSNAQKLTEFDQDNYPDMYVENHKSGAAVFAPPSEVLNTRILDRSYRNR